MIAKATDLDELLPRGQVLSGSAHFVNVHDARLKWVRTFGGVGVGWKGTNCK